ncbi:serine/threonine-protein kinase [Saccharopolyspora rectivirgula]|jgi:serine/threonine protein kinase|uniref:Protein kinase n=1 Tax=Saccharopolyspora rectivirgula TaxID=28042 RepID=A0A073B0N5_9PSEU|nr:serine/threonine-protein kinase [Saccharopolyspora rectivirgula]KEI45155.1 protein kinase [Saccharopolyspora rectivirgula]
MVSADTSASYYSEETSSPATRQVLAPGELLATGYRVVAHLRRGSRLDVYDVWSEDRSCRCVAKTLRPDRADDQRALGWLRNEGVMLTQLTHPNLVRGYEIVQTLPPVRPAVITETVPGSTLGYLIAEHGPLDPPDVAVLGMQLCSVLGYLHRRGWVHLDVKPSNVVAVGGRAVLLDLSLACRIGERSSAGTFDYLSPEQARGAEMTPAVDVWGLGVTLYESLCGRTPWADFSHRERTSNGGRYYPQTDQVAAPLRTFRRDVPAALAKLVDTCLEPAPGARPTIAEVSAQLSDWCGLDPMTVGAED